MSQEYSRYGSNVNVHGKISVFTPAGPPAAERISQGLAVMEQECPDVTEQLLFSDRIPAPGFPWLYDNDRGQAATFTALMNAYDSAFAWAVRGGYGILRWISMVEWHSVTERSPVVTGFSDITVLHAALNSRGMKSIHGPMLCTLSETASESREALWECFSRGKLPVLRGMEHISGTGRVTGMLTGGNLCCLSHLVGTPWEPPWRDCILLLEDQNESLYKIDRMLTHLLQSSRLARVRGVALGEFSGTGSTETMLHELLYDRLARLGVPLISGFPAGHGRDNMPLLLGSEYVLDAKELSLTPLMGV